MLEGSCDARLALSHDLELVGAQPPIPAKARVHAHPGDRAARVAPERKLSPETRK